MESINLLSACQNLADYWSPRIIGKVNDQFVKVAKLKGEFCWHSHEGEDEMFLVLKGQLTLQFEHQDIHLSEGDCFVVPRGVRHNPKCDEECLVALFEPTSTKHTGDVLDSRAKSVADQLK